MFDSQTLCPALLESTQQTYQACYFFCLSSGMSNGQGSVPVLNGSREQALLLKAQLNFRFGVSAPQVVSKMS